MSPSSPFYEHASRYGDACAIIDETGRHSFSQLAEASANVAIGLLRSVDCDDLAERPIAFLARPSFEYVALQWGIWQAGGIAVPLGVMHPSSEWQYVIEDTHAERLVFTDEFTSGVAELEACCQSVASTDLLHNANVQSTDLPVVETDRAAMLLYTSGTTSRPKGVVISHDNLNAQVDCLVEAWGWSSDDHILHVLPLHHVHGLVNALACPLAVGATCEFRTFNADDVWQRWVDEGPLNLFMAVPTIYAKLIEAYEGATESEQQVWSKAAHSRFRLMVSGSAALPVSVLEKWQRITGQRLLERYGMTEIGMALSNPLDGERVAGCVGRPLPGMDVRLIGEDGQPAADGTPGEIQVRGPSVFAHYWEREEATAEAFTTDGWFKTGDVADCNNGVYRILGRSSVDIIKTGGYKVSALEIEEVLRRHEGINNCAVVGVMDETWGEIVAAAIVGTPLDTDELKAWAGEPLAPYKVPRRIIFIDALPTNAMGKVTKPAVKELF